MYEGSSRTLFAKYAIPQMIGLVFNSVYMIVDGVFIGNVLGRNSMAAAAVAVPLIEILIAISMAVASGAGIIISGHLARNEKENALQVFDTALICAGIISVLIAVFGNIFIHPLTELLGSTPQTHLEATEYIRYILSFSPFLIFSFLLSGLVRNDGSPKLAMFALAFGSVSNIVLDYVFMCPLNMGIGGAALATAIGPVFSVIIMLPHFLFKKGNLYFAVPRLRLPTVRNIFTLGFPSFIMEFTIGIITFIYNTAIVKHGYGEIGLAAYLLIVLFSKNFFSIFNPGDTELIAFTVDKSMWYFCAFFLAGYNILMISFWQSTRYTAKALTVSLSRSIICLPLFVLILPHIFGGNIIWLCHSLSEAATAFIAFILLIKSKKQHIINK